MWLQWRLVLDFWFVAVEQEEDLLPLVAEQLMEVLDLVLFVAERLTEELLVLFVAEREEDGLVLLVAVEQEEDLVLLVAEEQA